MPSEHDALIRSILEAHKGVEGATLPILHAVQEALGYVPESTIPINPVRIAIKKVAGCRHSNALSTPVPTAA